MKLLDSGSAARKHEPAASDLLLCFTEAEARMAFTSVTSRMTTLISSLLYGSERKNDVYFRIFSHDTIDLFSALRKYEHVRRLLP